MKHILVTGANGQVGTELQTLAKQLQDVFTFHFTDVADLDITNQENIKQVFGKIQPAYVINCAAYTAVDKAETDKELCFKINTQAAEYLAEACKAINARFFHISSDYVYHNELNRPLLETDPTTPKGVYAATKLQGDLQALAANEDTIILRTSWVYSSFGHNFVKTMIRLGTERDSLGIVYDQIGAPAYARDIAATILSIIGKIEAKETAPGGVYNYVPQGVTCWYDFAKTIFELEGIECTVNSILSKAYPTPAARPTYSVLNCDKIKETFDITIPYWKDSLKACLQELKHA